MTIISISPLDPCAAQLRDLAAEARQEGYTFMDRLVNESRSGENLFQQPGECFLGIYKNNRLVGCGGLNQCPYSIEKVGRLRHIFIARKERRNGLATRLVGTLIKRGRNDFGGIRLRTPNTEAGKFYDAMGFETIVDEFATHSLAP